ncbi:MAG: hypothetical protein R3F11_00660 [Verrucomicrobiales bacterium]
MRRLELCRLLPDRGDFQRARPNHIGCDYGFGDLTAAPQTDSVVMTAEVLAPGGYGISINPLGDYQRTVAPAANFDISMSFVKTQFCDIDVLHLPACMRLGVAPNSIKCPTSPGGPFTLDLQVTNLMPAPVVVLNLFACQPSQLPPGAVTVTPGPVALPGGILLPGATVTVPVTLPGIPITGGKVCFCASLATEEPGVPPCEDILCVDLPNCFVPCMSLWESNVLCAPDPNNPGGSLYTAVVNVMNLTNTPGNVVCFQPCPPSQLPAGAINAVPQPAVVTLGGPLLNGQTAAIPISLPGVPTSQGGLACFDVVLKTAVEGQEICREKLCIPLPRCTEPCMALQATNVQCPPTQAGSYTLQLQITNQSGLPANAYSLSACPGNQLPAGSITVPPQPGSLQVFGSPLLPSASTTVPVALPGAPFTGANVCFVVTLFNSGPGGGGGAGGRATPNN